MSTYTDRGELSDQITAAKRRAREAAQNKLAAAIILTDSKYDGIMREWAIAFIRRLAREESIPPYPLLRRIAGEVAA